MGLSNWWSITVKAWFLIKSKWNLTNQVLSKDSAEELNDPELNPGPMTEIVFWEAKCMNLESLFEQMKAVTTKKMASILDATDRWIKDFHNLKLLIQTIPEIAYVRTLMWCLLNDSVDPKQSHMPQSYNERSKQMLKIFYSHMSTKYQ